MKYISEKYSSMKSLTVKSLGFLALLGVLILLPATSAQAAVVVGLGVGVGPGYVSGPPVCAYGYYPDYPYGCAPYGYYGPSWFAGGVFIGAGPWYHGWGHPVYPAYGRGFYGHGPVVARGFEGRVAGGHGFVGRGPAEGFHGGGFHRGR
jgi:hypothetical protein